jgi:hypothetical protein
MPLMMRTELDNLLESHRGQDTCDGVLPLMDWLLQMMKKIKKKKVMVVIAVACR